MGGEGTVLGKEGVVGNVSDFREGPQDIENTAVVVGGGERAEGVTRWELGGGEREEGRGEEGLFVREVGVGGGGDGGGGGAEHFRRFGLVKSEG